MHNNSLRVKLEARPGIVEGYLKANSRGDEVASHGHDVANLIEGMQQVCSHPERNSTNHRDAPKVI